MWIEMRKFRSAKVKIKILLKYQMDKMNGEFIKNDPWFRIQNMQLFHVFL